MTDLDERYRALAGTRGRDLWPDIEARQPRVDITTSSPRGRRLIAAVTALLVAGVGVGLTVRAFRQEPREAGSPRVAARLTAIVDVAARGRATAVAAAGGQVWVTAYGVEAPQDQVLLGIDPQTDSIVGTISLEAVPSWETGGGGIAYGHQSLWVTGARRAGSRLEAILQRIDPTTNEVVATIPLGFGQSSDVAVNDDAVWVTSYSDQADDDRGELARVDPATNEVVATIPLAHAFVRRVVALADAIVIEEWGDLGTVIQVIDAASNAVSATSGQDAWKVSYGRLVEVGDEVWATLEGGFSRVDLTTGNPSSDAVGHGVSAGCVGAGSTGIWLIVGRTQLYWLDTRTGEQTVALDDANLSGCIAAAVAQDSLWLLTLDGELVRVAVS